MSETRTDNTLIRTHEDYEGLRIILQEMPNYKGFEIRGDEIWKNGKLLVDPSKSEEFLMREYNSPEGVGKGQITFYKLIASKYLGIHRTKVIQFLKEQPAYQLTLHKNPAPVPITATKKREMYCADLVDMSNYLRNSPYKHRYILVCVDVFTRYTFLRSLKEKSADIVKEAFASIVRQNGKPSRLLTDNGLEFDGEFDEYLKEEHIHHLRTASHSPQSNGIVERANRQVRDIMREFMLRNDSKDWNHFIWDIQTAKNATYNRMVDGIPQKLWDADPQQPQPATTTEKRKKAIHENSEKIRVGDYVRIKMSSIFASMRQKIKAGEMKNLIVTFTPITFKVLRKKKRSGRTKYAIERIDDENPITDKDGKVVYFSVDSLQKHTASTREDFINMKDALRLNNIKRTQNDLNW